MVVVFKVTDTWKMKSEVHFAKFKTKLQCDSESGTIWPTSMSVQHNSVWSHIWTRAKRFGAVNEFLLKVYLKLLYPRLRLMHLSKGNAGKVVNVTWLYLHGWRYWCKPSVSTKRLLGLQTKPWHHLRPKLYVHSNPIMANDYERSLNTQKKMVGTWPTKSSPRNWWLPIKAVSKVHLWKWDTV